MKRTAFLFSMFLPVVMWAKIWTIDNSPGAGSNFTDIIPAVSAASAGDTLLVMPSYTGYNGFTLNKKLFVYSRGHTSNQIDKDKRAVVGSISITADNCVVQGLYINGSVSLNGSNNSILNNLIVTTTYFYGNNNLFQGNVVVGINCISFSSSTQNNLVLNNYMAFWVGGGSYGGTSFYFIDGGNSSNLVSNNLMAEIQYASGQIGSGGFVYFKNSYVRVYNNIFWSNVPNRSGFDTLNYGSYFEKNLTYSTTNTPKNLPGTNYNDTMPVFIAGYDASNPPFFGPAADYRIKPGTLADDAGSDSTDLGLFGQGFNFSTEGNVQGVAIFTDFKVHNPVIKKGGTLRVRLKARKPE